MSEPEVLEEAPARPLLRIVRGEPTAEELAALVAVLASRGGAAPQPEPVRSPWARPILRQGHSVVPVHPGAWRESGWTQGLRTRADW